MKKIRKLPWVNKIIRSAIKGATFDLPNWIKPIQAKWSISGCFNLKINDKINIKYYSNGDDKIADILYYNPKAYSEITELLLFSAFAEKSENIFDIGANTGLYSITVANVYPKAKIWAFEPYPENSRRLLKNVKLNNLENIFVIENAVGDANCMVQFTVPEQDQICDVLSVDHNFTKQFYTDWIRYKQININQISLDSFILNEKLNSVDLIKIDVENYELAVLRGAKTLLQQFSPVILCEIFVNDDKIIFFEEFMKPLGYHCYLILSDGIVRSEALVVNPNCSNYIFSKQKSEDIYLSFKNMEKIVAVLKAV